MFYQLLLHLKSVHCYLPPPPRLVYGLCARENVDKLWTTPYHPCRPRSAYPGALSRRGSAPVCSWPRPVPRAWCSRHHPYRIARTPACILKEKHKQTNNMHANANTHTRDISDQELTSCLHDQPRSCTFSTGDLLFVYTQYNENEHILWFYIYILYINLCDWQTKGMHLFKIKETFATQWDIVWFMNVSSWCSKCYPRSMDLNKRSQCIILLEQIVQYGVHVLTINHHNYSNISARRWARAAHSSTNCDMSVRLYKKDSQYTGLTLHDF